MPKASRVIKEFHGGLNSHAEKRDVANNELTEANDLQVDQLGKVVCMSSSVEATNGIIDSATTVDDIEPGYGLMYFQHDYAGMGSTYASNIGLQSATAISTSYTILSNPQNYQQFNIYGHPQDDKIDVELIPLQANREFNGTGHWATPYPSWGGQFGLVEESTINTTNYLGLNTGSGSSGKSVYLPVAKAPMSAGVSYKLTFLVDACSGTWTIKDYAGNTITTVNSNGSKEIQFVARGSGGIVIQSPESSNKNIDLDNFSLKEGGWSEAFKLESGDDSDEASKFKMTGFVVDGAVRIHDANFDNANEPLWFGYLNRKYFSQEEVFSGWTKQNVEYLKPLLTRTGSGQTGGSSYSSLPVAGKFNTDCNSESGALADVDGAITIELKNVSTYGGQAGTWDFNTNTYYFYISYIYDGGYDSKTVFLGSSTGTTAGDFVITGDNQALECVVTVKHGADNTWHNHHNPRIVGFRIHYKEIELFTTISEQLMCLQEVFFDHDKGSRPPYGEVWSEWEYSSSVEQTSTKHIAPPKVVSYTDINGFEVGDVVNAQFKASCVANRKTYIGNIKQDGTVYGDMMIKSPVNGFDLFPKSRSLEVTVSDGDEIMQLEEYADRILQFKKGKMHLINVSQEIEFLEDTFVHKGISNPNATCKTDFGVAWVNKHGCYLYDGKQVTNLLEKKNVKVINEDDWAAHVSDSSIIDYIPKKRQLIIIKDANNTADGNNIYLFDMVTKSWVTSDNAVGGSSVAISNTVIDKNGDLMWARKESSYAKFKKWSTVPVAQSNFALRTKAFAFGNPSQRKKIYKVYITHKNAGSSQLGLYGEFHSQKALAGQGVGELSNDFFFGYLAPDSGNSNNFIQQEFSVPSANLNNQSIDFNSVYTLRLYILSNKVWSPNSNPGGNLVGTAPADFEINDITVVYRLKSVK